jgi:hypothetical protein
MAVAVGLVVTALIYAYWTYASATNSRCAGQEVFSGNQLSYFLELPFFGLAALVPIALCRNSQQIADIIANYDVPVFQCASIRITLGALVVYSSLVVFVAIIGLMTLETQRGYSLVARSCDTALRL